MVASTFLAGVMMADKSNTVPRELITVGEAARRIGRSKKTLMNWIYDRRLRGENGLYYVAGRPMVDWAVFERAFIQKAA
jgi:hypothetical protein